ncbi:MAG: DEAD/DEAH box helicase [Betaproteobacteria bacterium]|nr:DEAD/DEAH box helicase [Betaproteobacteria bacterium]
MNLSYHAPSKSVVWQGDVSQLQHVIPDCKLLTDDTAVAPLRLDTQAVAARLGIPSMSPILVDYDWPGQFQPFAHQREMAAFLTLYPRAHNLAEIGTGKTMGVLWAADYLMRSGVIHKALVIAPRSTLTPVWRDHIGQHFAGLRSSSVVYGSRVQREAALAKEADFYIINNEGVEIMLPKLLERHDIDLVVVDESHRYRNHNTARYKALVKLLKNNQSLWLCTGTPTPNVPTDAWAQQNLLAKPDASFYSFRDAVMFKASQFRWVPRNGAEAAVSRLMAPAIRFKRDECIDLPPTQVIPLQVSITKEQKGAIERMRTELRAEVGGAQIDAVHEGALRIKLLQILAGAVYDKTGQTHKIHADGRIEALLDIVEGSQRKLLVFAGFTSVVRSIFHALEGAQSCAMVTGDTSQKARDQAFQDFQTKDSPRILVADPRTMAHGLTLTAADTIVWYSPVDSGDIYVQANGRITRPGQEHKTLIYQLYGDKLEREIYRRLDAKEGLQNLVMDWLDD